MTEHSDQSTHERLKQALLTMKKLRTRLESVEQARGEPIAVVGIGCRFPGGASGPEAFWELLRGGVDAVTRIPPERWDADAYYDPDPDAPGKMYTREGSFITGTDRFDAAFFGISPREVAGMDPQQRIALEVCWEALEHAGLPASGLANTRTGVFLGMMNSDYTMLHQRAGGAQIDAYSGTGTAWSFLAGRVSYHLGLQGPSMVVDTACSSSLVTVHLACQSLRGEECDLALAGGVNLILMPESHVVVCRLHALAADGRCKTFDEAADGYGRGEGCGVVVLKRLSDALRDGDRVLALIRGSAVNHDGPSGGLTVPNGAAQQQVIRQALAGARVRPHEVGYVEAHGTGTPLGDPIEVRSLWAVLGQGRAPEQRLRVGSVKTNFGHLEGAAGISGLIKAVLVLQHGQIPPHLHLKKLNPYIAWDAIPLEIPTALTDWPAPAEGRRIAGVSSFGMSGINAHVVLEEPPAPAAPAAAPPAPGPHLLALSARAPEALRELARRYAALLEAPGAPAPRDLCAAAALRRGHLEQRLALVGRDGPDLAEQLRAFAAGELRPGAASGTALTGQPRRLVFVFCGQGAQWAGMGQGLYATQPVFRDALDRCAELIRGELGADIRPLMFGADERRATKDEEASGVDRTTGVADAGLRPDDGRTTKDEGASRVDRTTGVADAGLRPSSSVLRPDDGRTTEDEGASGVDRTTGVADAGLRPDDGRTTEDQGTSGVDRTTGVADAGLRPSSSVLGPEAGLRPSSSVLGPETGLRPSSSVLGPALERTEVAQPALFALQVALLEQLRAWGLAPDAVLGHSVGEVAAAYAAGALSLEDAVRVVCRRGLAMAPAAGLGRMAAVELAAAEAERRVAAWPGRLSVAAVNSPSACVVAGEEAALAELLEGLAAEEIFGRLLEGRYAFHSPQMAPFQAGLVQALAGLVPRPARLPIASSVTGALAEGPAFDAAYWGRNMREPVRFAAAADALLAGGPAAFLEVGPHPVLARALAQCQAARDQESAPAATLRRGQPEPETLLAGLAALYVQGFPVDWRGLWPGPLPSLALPGYPWQHERFWISLPEPAAERPRPRAGRHPLLGERLALAHAPESALWEQTLDLDALPYLRDHRIQGALLLPAAATVELALAGAAEAFGDTPALLERLEFAQALVLDPQRPPTLQVLIAPATVGVASFQLFSRQEAAGAAAWTLHASGRLLTGRPAGPPAPHEPPAAVIARCAETQPAEALYPAMAARGLEYGPSFQGLRAVWRRDGEALGRLELPAGLDQRAYTVHPALLDACFQALGSAVPAAALEQGATYLPVGTGELRLHGPAASAAWVHVRLREAAADTLAGDLAVLDADGAPLLELLGLRVRRLPAAEAAPERLEDWLYELRWEPQPLAAPAEPPAPGTWLILADQAGLGARLRDALAARGQQVWLVAQAQPDDQQTPDGPGAAGLRPPSSVLRPDVAQTQPDNQQTLDGPGAAGLRPPSSVLRPHGEVGLRPPSSVLRPDEELGTLLERFAAQPDRRGIVFLGGLDSRGADALAEQARASVAALHLAQAAVQTAWRATPRLWLVTRGVQALGGAPDEAALAQAPLWGLGRTLAGEHPELRCTLVDLDPADPAGQPEALCAELLADPAEPQVALRGAGRAVARLARYAAGAPEPGRSPADGRPFRLEIDRPGVLDHLTLRAFAPRPPAAGEVQIAVHAAGLNFLDVLGAMGNRPDRAPDGVVRLGAECAGMVVALGAGVEGLHVGQRVVAVGANSFATHLTTPAELVAPVPEGLSLEQAAAIPVVFLTAAYALYHQGRLEAGERVLIHAASGGTGLAAIQLARRVGAEVLATAGSEEKRTYLRSLGIDAVMDSRSLDFAEQVLERTGGRGVDVVLNSLTGAGLARSLDVLAPYGRFLEIGKRDIYQNSQLGLSPFQRNLSYAAIDLSRMVAERPALCGRLLREVLGMFAAGQLSPPPLRVFPAGQAAEAFRTMAQARHIGKIVLDMRDPQAALETPAGGPRADGTYLISGGLGALGLELAGWLVEQGARHLLLLGRRAPGPQAQAALARMRAAGAQVRLAQADVAQAEQLAAALRAALADAPPLRGVVHAAAVLDDGVILQQNQERFERVLAPKLQGAWNLHRLTLDQPLDHFVLFSSIASLLGSPGQANYAAANAALDALAHYRRARGLPALSVNWGPWAEVGLAAAAENRGGRAAGMGIASLAPEQGLRAFARLLGQPAAQVAVMRFDARRWRASAPQAAGAPLFALLADGRPSDGAPAEPSARAALLAAEPAQRPALLEQYLREQLGLVLRLTPGRIERLVPLQQLGLDSLMALDLRNRLEAGLGLRLSATLVWGHPTLAALAAHLGEKLGLAAPAPAAPVPAPAEPPKDSRALDDLRGQIDQLSEEDALKALLGGS